MLRQKTMYRNLLNLLTCVLLLPACSGTAPHISIVCEENNVGNSIVKWEIAPLIKGNVKVYASTDPNNIPEDSPQFPYGAEVPADVPPPLSQPVAKPPKW